MKATATTDLDVLLYIAWLAVMTPFVLTYENMGLVWAVIMTLIGLLVMKHH